MSKLSTDAQHLTHGNTELAQALKDLYTDLVALRAPFAGLLTGSATWNAGSIADGDMESKDITVTGAALGDFVLASLGVDVVDLGVVAQVTAANVVTVTLLNNTGGAVDLASTTARVAVLPFGALAAPATLLTT